MQNQYFGDIGDFVKYGLLRQICGLTSKRGSKRKLSLGVVWYLMPNGGGNDGGNTSYLHDPEEYRECDVDLYDFLKSIVCAHQFTRKVSHIQESVLFPSKTVYHDKILPYGEGMEKAGLLKMRDEWLGCAKHKVRNCDVVFCDPDNGFAVKSVGKQNDAKDNNGGKYVFCDEAKTFCHLHEKQTVVFYQHRDRNKNQIGEKVGKIRMFLPDGTCVFSVLFKSRMFFVIPSLKHRDLVSGRLNEIKDGPWARVGLEVCDH